MTRAANRRQEKTGKRTGPVANAALIEATKNRDAVAGILVFDGVKDAPLAGRRYAAHAYERIMYVYEPGGDRLGLEIACRIECGHEPVRSQQVVEGLAQLLCYEPGTPYRLTRGGGASVVRTIIPALEPCQPLERLSSR